MKLADEEIAGEKLSPSSSAPGQVKLIGASAPEKSDARASLLKVSGISVPERASFFRDLGLMLEKGVPVLTALDTLAGELAEGIVSLREQRKTLPKDLQVSELVGLLGGPAPKKKRRLVKLKRSRGIEKLAAALAWDISSGLTLSAAMKRYPEVFNSQHVGLVVTGEMTGSLPVVLESLAASESESYQRTLEVKKSLINPLLTIAFALLGFLIIPGVFFGDFVESGLIKSGLGATLIRLSSGLTHPGFLIVFAAVSLIAAWALRNDFRRQKAKATVIRWLRVIPPVARIINARRALCFVQSLQLLLRSGILALKAVELSIDACADEQLSAAKEGILDRVKSGETLAPSLEQVDFEFLPKTVLSLIHVGEESGKLETLLTSAAFILREDLNNRIQTFFSLLQPFILLGSGFLVGLLCISVIQSISTLVVF